jgi:hypothetical protein
MLKLEKYLEEINDKCIFCNKSLKSIHIDIEIVISLPIYFLGPIAPTPVKVNCGLNYFVTLVTYCYNNVFVYFNL